MYSGCFNYKRERIFLEKLAYRIDKAGAISRLRMVTEELQNPTENEVTIEVKAIGLNFADIFALLNLYSATPSGSFIPGLEFSGIVVSVGTKVNQWQEGDKVMGAIRFGAYSSHLNIDERYIFPLPESWTFEEGASYLITSVTAYYALVRLANVQKGQTVLIHSAVGGVGIYANRLAKKLGAHTIGTIGREEKRQTALTEGYDEIYVRDSQLREKLSGEDGRRIDIVLDAIGGDIFKLSYDLLAQEGRLITYGAAHFAPEGDSPNYLKLLRNWIRRPKIDPLDLITHNKSVMGFNLIWLWHRFKDLHPLVDEIEKLDLGRPFIGKIYPFTEMHSAITYLQSGKSTGKVVVYN